MDVFRFEAEHGTMTGADLRVHLSMTLDMTLDPCMLIHPSVISNVLLFSVIYQFDLHRHIDGNLFPNDAYHVRLARLLYTGEHLSVSMQLIHDGLQP